MKKYAYFVFSSTPYRIGKLIQNFTGETHNHVSIALDPQLQQMYGFARRYYRTPLYGGFVKESLSRYHVNGQAAQVRICRVAVTDEQYEALERKLREMYREKERYLYNHLSVFTVPFRRLVRIKDAYICVEFAAHVLQELGMDIDPGNYHSVGELERLLGSGTVYDGPIPQPQAYDAEYFSSRPVPPFTTVRAFSQLLRRIGQPLV